MKKTLMTLAVMAVAAFAPTVSAQSTSGVCPQSNKECTLDKKVCTNKQNNQCRVLDGCAPGECIFKTLNLSDEQRGKIRELNVSESNFRENLRKESKVARQANDSTMRVAREKHQREYLSSLKQILTADQYVQFLEESYVKAPGKRLKKDVRANIGCKTAKNGHHKQARQIKEGNVKAGEIRVKK